jgi:hypothetical protein
MEKNFINLQKLSTLGGSFNKRQIVYYIIMLKNGCGHVHTIC